jgi:hypothetical protein
LYWDIEVTSEDEDEMIEKIAQKIHESGMNMAAILMIESFKPMSYIGAQMGRFFISPFLPVFGENIGIGGEKILQIFEKQENLEKLVKAVEALEQEEEERKKAEKAAKREKKKAESGNGKTHEKGWRRFLPF